MQQNVLIFQRRMTEYRVPLFDLLQEKLQDKGVRLTVAYGDPTREEAARKDRAELQWGLKVKNRYLRVGTVRAVFAGIPAAVLQEQDLVVIPHENSLLFNYLLLLKRLFGKSRIAYWGHGTNFGDVDAQSYGNRLRAWTVPLVDWWFAYTALSVRKVIEAGFAEERITCLNNAIDTRELKALRKSIHPSEVEQLRQELGLKGNSVGVFIGSMHSSKRIDFLCSSAEEIKRILPEFELVMIGDGSLRGIAEDFAASRSWCLWAGALHGREKALYLSLGQVMLNPGMVGLGILDSFVFGLPMVTTDCNIHSPEIAYLESGHNGLMVEDSREAFVQGVVRLLQDKTQKERMADACLQDASRYSIEGMADAFTDGIVKALNQPLPGEKRKDLLPRGTLEDAPRHIAVIWQRFLPYHVARLRHLQERLAREGIRLSIIEVASSDLSYGFPEEGNRGSDFKRICCFPGTSYHDHKAGEIHEKVLGLLHDLMPDVVFAPATPFPEGIAAVAYRLSSGKRVVMMDDAWEHTARRSLVVQQVKKLIHCNIDAVFVPAPSHRSYYEKMGFAEERIIFGVDVVDNDYFSSMAEKTRQDAEALRKAYNMPQNYFLFVGRFLSRKGIEDLLAGYKRYRISAEKDPWDLILVGGGHDLETFRTMAKGLPNIHFVGPRFGDDLCRYYALAGALIAPSLSDPWGLVINESMASGLPVIVSKGCGAAKTLVREGVNGWTFDPGDVETLAGLMSGMSELSHGELKRMAEQSQNIISEWSLEKFSEGVLKALTIPRRPPAGFSSNLATRLWKGRVRPT
jgi:glycosyltransferase involved in cell wall biosynthesis